MSRKKTPVVLVSKDELSWKREVLRQSFHLVLGFFLSGLLFFTNLNFFRIALLVLFIFGIFLVFVARSRVFSPLNQLLDLVQRKNERVPGQSAFMFVLGALIPSFLFSNPFHVFLGVFALTWQDGFSTLFGVRFGKTKIFPSKSLEGSLGGLVACTLGLSIFLPFQQAFILSLVATVVEILPIDDSLSIPFVVAFLAPFLV